MASGLIPRGVQLQGWSIDEWLRAPPPISSIAKKVLANLRIAQEKGFISFGCSAYSHAFLPLLSTPLAYAQMKVDYLTIKQYLGKPNFFWFPECALNSKLLRILHLRLPFLIPILSDKALNKNGSRFIELEFEDGSRERAVVASTLAKDVLMNAVVYSKPSYVPSTLDWKMAVKSMREGECLLKTLEEVDPSPYHVVVRDWENGESRDALVKIGERKEIKAYLEVKEKVSFSLFYDYGGEVEVVPISSIKPSCWEPLSTPDNPFPYWSPTRIKDMTTKKLIEGWKSLLQLYDETFVDIVEIMSEEEELGRDEEANSLKAVDLALSNERFYSVFKNTSPSLLSCLPWHILGREEWERFPQFPRELLRYVLKPKIAELISYLEKISKCKEMEKKERLEYIYTEMESCFS